MKLNQLSTETRNPETMHLDECSSLEIIQLMNAADTSVARAYM